MGVKLTTEEFVLRSVAVHGEKYDYSKSIYDSVDNKTIIKCRIHGEFLQTPYNHMKGHGCKICSSTSGASGRVVGSVKFIERAKTRFGSKFDYSLVQYKNNSTQVKIICHLHGEFLQTPVNHLNSPQGCPDCFYSDRMKDTPSFIHLCKGVHGNTYDYSLVDYKDNKTKVSIICEVHGVFKQTPANHSQGQKCPYCSKTGIKLNLPTFLYVITSEELTKVGISNVKSRSRIKEINTNSRRLFKEITRFNFSSGHTAAHFEKEILQWLSNNYKRTSVKFIGMTECFEDVDNTALLNKILKMIKDDQNAARLD